MTITASKLRQNIYKLLDRVAKTGVPIEITRKGVRLKIIAEPVGGKLKNLKKRKLFAPGVDPESIVHMDWSKEWKPFI